MDKKKLSFLQFVYRIILFIVLLPVKVVKYFLIGFLYSFYVTAEIIFKVIMFPSFVVYKIFKYFVFGLCFPIVISNILKRNRINNKNMERNIVYENDVKKENLDEPIIETNEINSQDDIVIIPDQENQFIDNMDQNFIEIEENLEEPVIETSDINSESISDEENQPIGESIDDIDKNFIKSEENIKSIKIIKPKRRISLRKLFLPLELISYPIYKLFKYLLFGPCFFILLLAHGFSKFSYFIYKIIKYLIYSLFLPKMIYNVIRRKNIETFELREKIREEKRIKKQEEKFKKQLQIQQRQEDKLRRELKRKKVDEYVNENVKIEKKSLKQKIDDILNIAFSSPKVLVDKIKESIHNSDFAKNRRNKRDMSRQALLINFDGEDAEKSDIKLVYQYKAKNPDGKIVVDYFEAFSKVEVHSFLLSEGYEVYNIKTNKWIQTMHKPAAVSGVKMKNKDLIFFLTQLSTYIKAGIPLVDSLRTLKRQYSKNKNYDRLFKTVIYDLTMGESFSNALEKQKNAFPRILINMVKAAEMTGELPEALDDMSEYFTQMEKTRKQMVTALMYPLIILVFAIGVVIFILMFVIPKFVDIYNSMDSASIPKFTLLVLGASNFLKANIFYILIITIILIVIFIYLYKNVKVFRTIVQWVMMHTPVIKNVIIYNEVTTFTKTFSSLLAHNVFITDSMNILNKVTNNEIYKMLILDTITNLARGEKISTAFENHWAFPIPAYEMLVTGEKTGQLPEMMKKVSEYYQELHQNSVTRIKTFIEPFLIVFLTVVVGAIVLAIVIPMFNLYQSVQNLG